MGYYDDDEEDYGGWPHNKNQRGLFAIGLIALAMLVYFAYTQLYLKNTTYTAQVINKKSVYVHSKNHGSYEYIIKLRTTRGRTFEINVYRELYNRIRIGDWVKKDKGQIYPRIVSSGLGY